MFSWSVATGLAESLVLGDRRTPSPFLLASKRLSWRGLEGYCSVFRDESLSAIARRMR